jgi:hypothetical protein
MAQGFEIRDLDGRTDAPWDENPLDSGVAHGVPCEFRKMEMCCGGKQSNVVNCSRRSWHVAEFAREVVI